MAALGKTIDEILASTAPPKRALDALSGNQLGTDAPLLHRANASDTSVQAAYAVDTPSLEAKVLAKIRSAGTHGITQDELIDALPDVKYPSLTARFSALLRNGLIVDTGERREGRSGRAQRVLRAAEVEV